MAAGGSDQGSLEAMATASRGCQSCGDPEADVVLVRRLYVTPERWDQAGEVRVDEDEWWCFPCRTLYPHQELDPDGDPVEHELGWSTEPPAG